MCRSGTFNMKHIFFSWIVDAFYPLFCGWVEFVGREKGAGKMALRKCPLPLLVCWCVCVWSIYGLFCSLLFWWFNASTCYCLGPLTMSNKSLRRQYISWEYKCLILELSQMIPRSWCWWKGHWGLVMNPLSPSCLHTILSTILAGLQICPKHHS